jgi:hypothetical protein
MRRALIVAALLSSLIWTGLAAERENSLKFYDEEDAALFSSTMKQRGIPFRRDQAGSFWYPARLVDTVDEIRLAAHRRCGIGGVHYVDSRDAADYVGRLKQEAIPFSTCRKLGSEYIMTPPEFEARVTEIRNAVDDDSMRRAADERTKRRHENQ